MNKAKYVLCLEKRYGNFTYGKIYEAIPHTIRNTTKEPTNFRITDDDGDFYTIAEKVDKLKKNWEWII